VHVLTRLPEAISQAYLSVRAAILDTSKARLCADPAGVLRWSNKMPLLAYRRWRRGRRKS